MAIHRVTELAGTVLDAAVAQALAMKVVGLTPHACTIESPDGEQKRFAPSEASEFIEVLSRDHRISIKPTPVVGGFPPPPIKAWTARAFRHQLKMPDGRIASGPVSIEGPSPIVAALRALVAAKIGDVIELP